MIFMFQNMSSNSDNQVEVDHLNLFRLLAGAYFIHLMDSSQFSSYVDFPNQHIFYNNTKLY